MESLIRLKGSKFKIRFWLLVLPLLLFTEVKASVFDDIFAGRISETYSLPNGSLELPKAGDQNGYFDLQELLFLLGEEAAVHGNLQVLDGVYKTFDDLLALDLKEYYFSGDEQNASIVRMKIALIYDSLSLADPRYTASQKLDTIKSWKTIAPYRYLYNYELISFYTRMIDFYITENDWKEAEHYALICLSYASDQNGLFTNDIVKLMSRLFVIQAHFGRRHNLAYIAQTFDEIITSHPWYEAQGSTLHSYSMLMSAAAELGSFDYAELIQKVIYDLEAKGAQIPKIVRFNINFNDSILKAWNGQEIKNRFFDESLTEEEKQIPVVTHALNTVTIFSKVNASKNFEKADMDKLQLASEFSPENYKIYKSIALLYFAAQQGKIEEYKKSLYEIKSARIEQQRRKFSSFEYGKTPGFIDQQVKRAIFRTSKLLFSDVVPPDIAELILEVVTPTSSEVDMQIRAKNASLSNPNLISAPQTGLKLRKEFDFLLLSVLDQIKNNFLDFAKNDFVPSNKSEVSNIGFSFLRMLNGLRYENRSSISSKDLFNIVQPKPIDINQIKATLASSQVLVTYQTVDDLIFICHLKKLSTDCKLKTIEFELTSSVLKLRNDLLNSDRNIAFNNPLQIDFYKIFFEGFYLGDLSEVLINPLPSHMGLPFNILKPGNEHAASLGLKFALTIIPSLTVLKRKDSVVDFKGIYMGLGDPNFQISRNAEEQMESFFTVRSAVMANSLSDLTELPETRDEIINSAANFNDGESKVFLGEDATELNLRLNSIQDYRFIHFATHGLVSGEFEGLKSPGLALSINPTHINALNDGYLDAFEIAELEFNAELVVLSACQTVSDLGNPNAGFSGLTSAFLNAGVKGILSTQWKIESVSASEMIADFFQILSANKRQMAAIVLREIMNNAVKNGYEHPYYWSPFIYVSALTQNLENKKQNIFDNIKEIFSYYEVDERMEFTGLDSFEGDVWGTFHKAKFEKGAFATNYIFQLDNDEIVATKTPFGSVTIIFQNREEVIVSATYKEGQKTIPALYSFNKSERRFKKIIDFKNHVTTENNTVFKSLLPVDGKFFGILQGYTESPSDKQFEQTLWKLVEFTLSGNLLQEHSLFDTFGKEALMKDMLILNNGAVNLSLTYFPDYNSEFDFVKGEYSCTSYRTEVFNISNNLEFSKLKTFQGDLVTSSQIHNNSLLTIVDSCDGSSLFTTVDGSVDIIFPTYATQTRETEILEVSGNSYLIGYGDYRSSYLDRMLSYKPIRESNVMEWMENREYIISEDTSYFMFFASVNGNKKISKLSHKTSKMLSFINSSAANDNSIYMAGTIDRDRAFLWKLPLANLN